MALHRWYPFNKVLVDKAAGVAIGQFDEADGCIINVERFGGFTSSDQVRFKRISNTQYRPAFSETMVNSFAIVTLFQYREQMLVTTGIDFFTGIQVDNLGSGNPNA